MTWTDDKTLPGASLPGSEWNQMVAAVSQKTAVETLTNKTLTSPKINEDVVVTATSTELNYVDGVTSAIQTQLNTKLSATNLASTFETNNNNITELKQACFNGIIDDGNSSTADTIDWTTGSIHKSTLTGNCAYTFTSPTGASRIQLLIYTGAGSFAVTWPASVKWTAGTAPTITTTASKVDIATFLWDGTNYWGSITQNYSA